MDAGAVPGDGGGARAALRAELSRRSPFDRMERAHLDWLVERLVEQRHPRGAVLLGAGVTPDRLHLLRTGTVDLEAPGDLAPAQRNLGVLAKGDLFPVEALHEGRPHFAVFRAAEEVACLELSREHFRELQALSGAFREFCERRSQKLLDRWRRAHQVHLAQTDSVVNPDSVQQSGPRELGASIRRATETATLAHVSRAVRQLGRTMLARGVAASQLTKLLSSLNDKLAQRVVELEVERADLAGVDFCWVALGSEARAEQTLFSDQDNGMVFDPAGGDPEALRARLLPVARAINQALAACGFPLCEGGVMAGNPAWCLSVEEWRERFSRWLGEPDPAALLHACIFFDLRPVFGNRELVRKLQVWLAQAAPRNRRFLLHLVHNALQRRPPLGFLRGFQVETSGEHPGTIDLKLRGASLFVDAARACALATGQSAVSTEERLRLAGEGIGVSSGEVAAWVDSFHFLQVLRLRLQYQLGEAGKELHNCLDPEALNKLDRRILIEALRQAGRLQKLLGAAVGVEGAGL